ncbi:sensor histidine kinase [Neorhodopirellula lusitana]|uniref:sensor histidine kinase n=1 Tax=Neorhodopirellula lusitana TaxID=445327 RepID=UPI00385042B7
MLIKSLICLIAFSALPEVHDDQNSVDELSSLRTTVASIRNLSDAEANRRYPVQMKGTVLLATPSSFVFHDGETAIWCERPRTDDESRIYLAAGMTVEIKGQSNRGHNAPLIQCSEVTVTGTGELPVPRKSSFSELQSGVLDCQWVTIDGVGISAQQGNFLQMAGTSVVVSTFGGKFFFNSTAVSPEMMESVIDAEITVTGVCLPRFNNRGNVLDSDIMSCVSDGLKITKEANKNPFESNKVTLGSLFEFSPVWSPTHRKVVTGTVTACEPGHQIFITDGEHNLRVIPQTYDIFKIGDVIQCAGFLEMEENFPVLRTSIIQTIGSDKPPEPSSVTPDSVLSIQLLAPNSDQRDHQAGLVRLSGNLIAVEDQLGKPFQLILDADGSLVPVTLASFQPPRQLRKIRPGSTLEVTGICSIRTSDRPEVNRMLRAESFEIRLRSPQDVTVLSTASWWNATRLLLLLAGTVALLLAALLVIFWMRRRIAQRGSELAEARREKDALELVAATTKQERTRVAADLHDTLEQSLAGVALQLRAIETARSKDLADRNLSLATQILSQSREDLRRSVWNLRLTDSGVTLLREELRKTCLAIFSVTPITAEVGGRGEERKLDVLTTDNLLMIAKEAMTNALKHSSPNHIQIDVDYTADQVSLCVTDDGCGFDADRVAGTHQGHFGLTGMQERVRRIGGELVLVSNPEHGTRIEVTVPR